MQHETKRREIAGKNINGLPLLLSVMKMRNPLKPKKTSRRFAELQEDRGFSDAQFETVETPSKVDYEYAFFLSFLYY